MNTKPAGLVPTRPRCLQAKKAPPPKEESSDDDDNEDDEEDSEEEEEKPAAKPVSPSGVVPLPLPSSIFPMNENRRAKPAYPLGKELMCAWGLGFGV